MRENRKVLNARIPVRLYNIIMDIRPLFMDFEEENPNYGATTRALLHILQYYSETADYVNKMEAKERMALKMLSYFQEKRKET